MGQISKALGAGSEFEFQGQTYKLSPWTYNIQASFERHLESEAVKAARRMAAYLDDEEKRELLASVNRDIAAGIYTFGSELVFKAMRHVPHLEMLTFLCLKPNHPEVKMETVKEMVLEQIEELWGKMTEANADPTMGLAVAQPSPPTTPTPPLSPASAT